MRSILALLFLGVISSTSAQCASDNEDQQQLCYDFCFIASQCNDQCFKKPSNQNIGCLCQDACVCAMTICNSCCAAAGSQFEQLFCQSNAPLNLNMCEGPGIIPLTATAQFPPSIETFLNNVPALTGLTFSFATCTSSDQSTPEASATVTPSQTAAAAGSNSPSTSKASSGTAAASSGPSAGSSAAPAQAAGSPTAAATTAASATVKSSHGDSKTGGCYTLFSCLVGGGVLFVLL